MCREVTGYLLFSDNHISEYQYYKDTDNVLMFFFHKIIEKRDSSQISMEKVVDIPLF